MRMWSWMNRIGSRPGGFAKSTASRSTVFFRTTTTLLWRRLRPAGLRRLSLWKQAGEARDRRGANSAIGDQARQEFRRRHVEGWIGGRAAGRGDHHARDPAIVEAPRHVGDFTRIALLDLDLLEAVMNRPVDRGMRQSDIEGHVIGFGGERFQIGADLVGGVAARGDAIGADDAEVDAPMLHQMAAGIVGDDRMRHAMLAEFEGGQRGALIARPRLVDKDMDRHAAIMRNIDRRGRGAPVDSGEPASVAMSEHIHGPAKPPVRLLDQRQTGRADTPAEFDVFVADFAGARPSGLG